MQPASARPISFILASTDHGLMILNRNDHRTADDGHVFGVGAQLLAGSRYDPLEISVALQLLTARRLAFGDGIVALDCGANIGVHTVEWARAMNGWGQVLAFEAQERVYYALAGNIAINNCRNARALHAAVGAAPGDIVIPDLDHDQPASFGSLELRARPEGSENIGQEIDYGRLDTRVRLIAIDELDLPRLDLIKIDVEGMEVDVLRGAEASLRRHKPILIVETLKSGLEPIQAFLEPLGYRSWPWGANMLLIHENDPTAERISYGDASPELASGGGAPTATDLEALEPSLEA